MTVVFFLPGHPVEVPNSFPSTVYYSTCNINHQRNVGEYTIHGSYGTEKLLSKGGNRKVDR